MQFCICKHCDPEFMVTLGHHSEHIGMKIMLRVLSYENTLTHLVCNTHIHWIANEIHNFIGIEPHISHNKLHFISE